MVDANTNGLSDVWEAVYAAPGIDPNADPDGDGQNNRQESVAGTDPFDASSVFRVQSIAYLPGAYLLRWDSTAGTRYQVEGARSFVGDWESIGDPVNGTGGTVLAAVPTASPPLVSLRLRLLTDNPAVTNALDSLAAVDTDGDGFPDVSEFGAGTDMFDASSKLSIASLGWGRAVQLQWPTVRGKSYQVEGAEYVGSGSWEPEGGAIAGTGSPVTVSVEVNDSHRVFRVSVTDLDSDSDGVTDWEERIAGVDADPLNYRINHPTLAASITERLVATNVINVEPDAAVANATMLWPGRFMVTRSGNLNPVTVHYTVAGDAVPGTDYQPLSGVVTLPMGVDTVAISVVPLAGAQVAPARGVTVTLQANPAYTPGTNATAQVNVVKEIALDVTAFGAMGDGVTDDTVAIQSAINALEASTNYNTLHFPPGTYRLNSPTFRTSPTYNWYQLLKLGNTEMAGRDLFFTGDTGAVLYSTVSWVRAHMITIDARFRSLTFHGLSWRKEGTALPQVSGEPNFASGVDLRAYDLRQVEALNLYDCTFDNCHPSVSASGVGFDLRGRLAHFVFQRCKALNPYGSNTTNAWTALGGGQQMRLDSWVNHALYADSYFDGGTNGTPDPAKNPGGIRKDGSHFGSPLRLVFTNNIVRRMAVEAVDQTDDPYMGATASPFTIPPADGTAAQSAVLDMPTTFSPGQILNYRTWFFSGAAATNVYLNVVAYDPTNRLVTVTNSGLTPGVAGLVIPANQPIYLQNYNPTTAMVAGNLIDGGEPNGASGIVANAKVSVVGNAIIGYGNGVFLYENVHNPLFPPTVGSVIESNVILTHNSVPAAPGANGIISVGPGEIVANNLVVTPLSYWFVGVVTRSDQGWLEGNIVVPKVVQHQSYSAAYRSVGIGFGNATTNGTAVANRTYGMDVGVGPEVPFQLPPHLVISHFSTNDVLSIDPRGVIMNYLP